MIPLAWKNVIHKKLRTAVAVAGVAFSILMIFLQLGFFGSVKNTANSLFNQFDFDLVLVSPNYRWVAETSHFPRTRIFQGEALGAIKKIEPIYTEYSKWKNTETGVLSKLLIIGFDPRGYPFKSQEIKKSLSKIQKPDTLLIDKLSLPLFGPKDIGLSTEIENRKITIRGQFTWGIGFSADGAVVMSDQNFLRLFPEKSLDKIGLALVTLEDGISLEIGKKNLLETLPEDVKVYTRSEIGEKEFDFWLNVTATGPMFGAGVIITFIVGMVVLYQILSNEIMDNIKEYATLKAMGYKNSYFTQTVLKHGAFIAVLGYLPAFGLSFLLYDVTRSATNLPIYMTEARALFVLILSVFMCAISGYLSLGKIRMADPGELF